MNTKIECVCCNCNKIFQKPLSEYNRKIKNKTLFYCSLICSGQTSIKTNIPLQKWKKSKENIKHVKSICGNLKDQYSDFRETFRRIKRRGKKINITLDDLKLLWESQNGCCAILGHKIQLPTYKRIKFNSNYMGSLDRIDNTQGYVKGNIRWICLSLNYAKNKSDDKILFEFINLCKNNKT